MTNSDSKLPLKDVTSQNHKGNEYVYRVGKGVCTYLSEVNKEKCVCSLLHKGKTSKFYYVGLHNTLLDRTYIYRVQDII